MIELDKFKEFVAASDKTYSQLKQDLLILFLTKNKKNGYFVEFGGCDGKHLSNTYLLEKNYNWNGIIAEPAKKYQSQLKMNRNCNIEDRAVYKISGDFVEFREVSGLEEISGIENSLQIDSFKKIRNKRGNIHKVETISLTDLLKYHQSPKIIDYLSIDTEGSEYDILSNFLFDEYLINIITVEHNYIKNNRKMLKDLLESKDYVRIFENISEWDDWYIHKNFLKELQ